MIQAQYSPGPLEYSDAFRCVRRAKNVFLLLTLLAILIPLAAFCIVRCTSLIDRDVLPSSVVGDTEEASEADTDDKPIMWGEAIKHILSDTMEAAPIIAMLLTLTLFVAAMVSLVGRLGGVSQLFSAFFWSLILLAMLVPWQRVLYYESVYGALADYSELIGRTFHIKPEWGAESVSWQKQLLYYMRFVGYPVLALLVWLVVQVKFARGCKRMHFPPAVTVQADPAGETAGLETPTISE